MLYAVQEYMRYENQNFTIEANRECYCSPIGSVQGMKNMQQQEQGAVTNIHSQENDMAISVLGRDIDCLMLHTDIIILNDCLLSNLSWSIHKFTTNYTNSFYFFSHFLYSIQYTAPNTQQLDYVYGT